MRNCPELQQLAQEIAAEEGLSLEEATEKAQQEHAELMRYASGQWAEAIDPEQLGQVLNLALLVIEQDHPRHGQPRPEDADAQIAAEGLRGYLRLLGWMDPEEDDAPATSEPAGALALTA